MGIHRHYGTVWGQTIEGLFGYYEHEQEWMAGKYDVIYETPGSVHTLFVSPDSTIFPLFITKTLSANFFTKLKS